jgi:BASS family bile acid:Na+ symporter
MSPGSPLYGAARWVERRFLPIALGLSLLALVHPGLFTWFGPRIPLGLGLIMFGMGMTLELADFRSVLRTPSRVLLGLVFHYSIMPLLAFSLSTLLGLPREAAIGVVLVGACPCGTASNVLSYLAGANVALSVVLTLVSTAVAPLVTPAIVQLLIGERVDVDFTAMAGSVFWIVVFPLADGLILRRLLRPLLKQGLEPVLSVMPAFSILVISLVIACVVGLNRATLLDFPLAVMAAVVLHNLLGLALGYGAAKACRFPEQDARAVAIEVGVQNSGLAVALAVQHFGPASGLPGAVFSLWQNMSGSVLARWWSGRREGSGVLP